jgi:hypothetical protein
VSADTDRPRAVGLITGQAQSESGDRAMRGYLALAGVTVMLACREAAPPAGERTGSPYSTGEDSAARGQRIEGTGTGVELETPVRIPGILAALDQVKRQPDKENLTALRGNVGSLEDAMRHDLTRAGLADTGEFRALTDSLARDLGGGAGGLSDDPKPDRVARVEVRVRRLIDVHQRMMGTARK